MKVEKEALGGQRVEPTEEELALVNRQSRKELTAAEVYLFAVRLCDNEVDRDGEQFPQATLEQLAELFVGKSGIFDHRWSAGGQTARIYRTEVVREEGIRTALGEPACYLKGYAYMVRTQGNQDLIAEIEGGIKREVSVGCAVKRAECSICGSDMGRCAHEKGKRYDGRLCCARLLEATDAFELFVGKSGIFDHRWSAGGQTARIYRTEVVREEGIRTALGEPACYLKGYAYMVRTQGNQDLIAEIEGGIKREVSVGCAVKRAECSICGSDMGRCAHEKGKRYDGRLCCARLLEATDAFEFSFVAVPAQPRAGVMKRAGGSPSLKQLALGEPAAAAELEDLERAAELGRRYLTGLRNEVVRLGLLAERQVGAETLRHIADRLEEKELLELRENYQRRAAERYPIAPQLSYGNGDGMPERPDGAFLI